MATLHVRNVPDPIYEALRERAASSGRSIGAEVVMLLESELGPAAIVHAHRLGGGHRRRQVSSPFDRFGPRAKQAVLDAHEAARSLQSAAVGTEHLLLGVLHDPPTLASAILEAAGVDRDAVLSRIQAAGGEIAAPPSEGLPFSADAKRALEFALRACINLRDLQIEPEHLLQGISQVGDSLGGRILYEAGQSPGKMLKDVVAGRSVDLGGPRFRDISDVFRVLELKGEASDWERELNAFASRGYTLVEIVDGRAIFAVSTPAG
ncbi:MAG TPA: Clp protease N-terminal domain-containing protein [Gaiellaceae bacterium]|jgi:plasmid stability protein|nr:Clp protease N-terminal domain-containing protein [Gaiellaceae bacterium]